MSESISDERVQAHVDEICSLLESDLSRQDSLKAHLNEQLAIIERMRIAENAFSMACGMGWLEKASVRLHAEEELRAEGLIR